MKAQLAQIRTMLVSQDLSLIVQAIELLTALDDAELWDALAADIAFKESSGAPAVHPRTPDMGVQLPGFLELSGTLRGTQATTHFNELAALLVVSRGPLELREQITGIRLEAATGWHAHAGVVFAALCRLPNLRRLIMAVAHDLDLSALAECGALAELLIEVRWNRRQRTEPPLVTIAALSSLEALTLEGPCRLIVRDLDGLNNVQIPWTHRITMIDASGFSTVRSLDAGQSTSAEFLEHFPALAVLAVERPTYPVAHFPSGVRVRDGALTIDGNVTSLGNIAETEGLRFVDMRNYVTAIDWSSLALVADLRVLDARNSSLEDITIFEHHPSLRRIAAFDSQVDPTSVPESMAKVVTFAKSPSFKTALAAPVAKPAKTSRAPAKKQSGASATARQQATQLRRLLTSQDPDDRNQGIELAASVPDSAAIDLLLTGVTWAERVRLKGYDGRVTPAIARLMPNKAFSGSTLRQPMLDMALARVVANSNHPLREEITALTLGQWVKTEAPLAALHLRDIAKLPNLKHLELLLIDETTECDLTELAHFVSLTALTIRSPRARSIPSHATLERVRGTGPLVFTKGGQWPALLSVELTENHSGSINALVGTAPRVQQLSLGAPVREIAELPALAQLSCTGSVQIRDCPALADLTITNGEVASIALTGGLRRLQLTNVAVDDFEFVRGTTLEHVEVHDPVRLGRFDIAATSTSSSLHLGNPELSDIGDCGDLDGLQRLDLSGVTKPVSLETLRHADELRVLDIRGATGITDLAPLADLTELRMIAAFGSGVLSTPASLTKIVSRAENPNLDRAFTKPVPDRTTDRPTPPTPIPVPESQRADWEGVLIGLSSKNRELAFDAAALVGRLDPAGLAFILDKIDVDQSSYRSTLAVRSPLRLDPTDVPAVVGRLLRDAPDSPKAKQLRQLNQLRIRPGGRKKGVAVVSGFGPFTSLQLVDIAQMQQIHVQAMPDTRIKTLRLTCNEIHFDEVPDSVRKVIISEVHSVDFSAIARSHVEDLVLRQVVRGFDLATLHGATSLRSLEIFSDYADPITGVEHLVDIPLRSLKVNPRAKIDLTPLVGHPTLEKIDGLSKDALPVRLQSLASSH